MATQEIPILGAMTAPDASGDAFPQPLETAMTLSTATFGTLLGVTMLAPTGSDIGIYGKFTVPQDYVGTPVLVIRGVIEEAANTLAFGFQQIGRVDNDPIDVAFEAEDLASAVPSSHTALDLYVETIPITPTTAYVAGAEIFFFFFRDDSVDNQTGAFHLSGLSLRYSDA